MITCLLPFSQIINYKYKWADCLLNFEQGVYSKTPNDPPQVIYIHRLQKYLVQDGNHRIIKKAIEHDITKHYESLKQIECIEIKPMLGSTDEDYMGIFKDCEKDVITLTEFLRDKESILEKYRTHVNKLDQQERDNRRAKI